MHPLEMGPSLAGTSPSPVDSPLPGGDDPGRGRLTVLERARVRARLRTEVRSALRTATRSPAALEVTRDDVPLIAEAVAGCARRLHSLGVSAGEALSDFRISLDEMDLPSHSPLGRRSIMAEAQRHVHDLYRDVRAD